MISSFTPVDGLLCIVVLNDGITLILQGQAILADDEFIYRFGAFLHGGFLATQHGIPLI